MTFKVKTKGQIEGEKLLVPKLRFKEFNNEGKRISLINVFTFYKTNSLSRADLSEEGLIKNIHYGDIHQKFNNILDVNKEKLPYIKSDIKVNIHNEENYCQDGDLILADASEDYDGIGKSVEVINVGNNKIVSGLHTILARDTNKVISLGFKGYLFNTSLIHNQIRVLANGFKVYGISKNNIYDLDVRIPTKTEQEKITNFLILLDKKIELQQRRIEALKIYKTGLFNKIYKEKLNDIKESKLREYAYLQGGYAFKSELFSKKGTPIIRIANINENIVDLKDVVFYDKEIPINFKFEINTGDILIAMSGATTGKIGIYKEKMKSYLNQRVGKIVLKRKDMIYSYLYFLFELSSYNMQLNTKLVAGAQPNISPTDIENLKFKIPSIKLQEHIANIVMNINKKLEIEGNKLQELNELKKGLLQKMFI